MPTVTLPRGEVIWYRTTGQGAPLLQVHGSAFGHRHFDWLTPVMARSFEVIDFDLPGYGESRDARGQPGDDLAVIAEQIHQFIRALNHPRVHLHGTALGAMLGLKLATMHPEVIDHLVLSCFMVRHDTAARNMRKTWQRAAQDSGMAALADLTSVVGFSRGFHERPDAHHHLEAMRAAFRRNTPAAFVAGTEAIKATDLSALPSKVKSPTLLLAASEDHMTPFRPAGGGIGMAHIASQFANARTVMLEDCGHYLVIEQPERAASAIVSFIKP